jgi:hypothetical protein
MLRRTARKDHNLEKHELVHAVVHLMRQAEANGVDSVAVLSDAIAAINNDGPPRPFSIMDQLVQRAGWMKRACSG